MTLCVSKQKACLGYLAPCTLRVYDQKEADEISNRDTVLLGIWKTRCVRPRVDIIIWKPWMTSDKRVELIKGVGGNSYLRSRYCVFDEKFDVTLALA